MNKPKNNIDDRCKGCLMYENYKRDPDKYNRCVGNQLRDIGCPCQNCLIKMMCTTTCSEIEERDWIGAKREKNKE